MLAIAAKGCEIREIATAIIYSGNVPQYPSQLPVNIINDEFLIYFVRPSVKQRVRRYLFDIRLSFEIPRTLVEFYV